MKALLSAFITVWLMLLQISVAQANVTQKDPKAMVQGLSDVIINTLNAKRAEFESSNEKVLAFADQYVLPYVDTEKMARYALGRYWRTATEAQQQAFTKAFTESLIRSYSQNFLKLNIEKVEVGDVREDKPGRVSIDSEVFQQGGQPVSVVYRAFQDQQTGKWMLYDVVIENVSMLLSYRTVYSSAVSSKGLDKVIAELQEKNRQAIAQ